MYTVRKANAALVVVSPGYRMGRSFQNKNNPENNWACGQILSYGTRLLPAFTAFNFITSVFRACWITDDAEEWCRHWRRREIRPALSDIKAGACCCSLHAISLRFGVHNMIPDGNRLCCVLGVRSATLGGALSHVGPSQIVRQNYCAMRDEAVGEPIILSCHSSLVAVRHR